MLLLLLLMMPRFPPTLSRRCNIGASETSRVACDTLLKRLESRATRPTAAREVMADMASMRSEGSARSLGRGSSRGLTAAKQLLGGKPQKKWTKVGVKVGMQVAPPKRATRAV